LLCEEGHIRVNNIKAKASRNINTGDYITIELKDRSRTYKVISVPEKHSRLSLEEIVKLISDENLSNEDG